MLSAGRDAHPDGGCKTLKIMEFLVSAEGLEPSTP